MNCLDNLNKCKAECCRYFVFDMKGQMTDDLKKYYNAHENVKVIGEKVYIYNKCKYLGKDNKCKVYFRPELRPKICKEGYTETDKGVDYPKSCIFPLKQE